MRAALPWILLSALVVAWGVSTRGQAPSEPTPPPGTVALYSEEDIARMQRQIAELEDALARRDAAAPAPRPDLAGAAPEPALQGRVPESAGPGRARSPASAGAARRPGDGALRRVAYSQSKVWSDALRAEGDPEARDRAQVEVLRAIEGGEPAELLAALTTARWMDPARVDRGALRAQIDRYLDHESPAIARAALEAGTVIQPRAGDEARWIAVALADAPGSRGETTMQMLVQAADGRVEGRVAEAALHLLRTGGQHKQAFLMRGLQGFKTLSPELVTRMIDIAGAAAPTDYDSHYFFHFIAPRIDPKGDRLVDLTLELLAGGKSQASTLLRSLRRGLSEGQKQRAAERLLTIAEGSTSDHLVGTLLQGVGELGNENQVGRLEALARRDDLGKSTQTRIAHLIETLQRR